MRVLYIAHYGDGSTSRMRGEILKTLLQPAEFRVADTDVPVAGTNRLSRSLGWRWYKGLLITNVGKYLLPFVEDQKPYDVIWVDKGVFIRPALLSILKAKAGTLIHYTPDTAFAYNRSKLFFEGIDLYDYCITTKSFEVAAYEQQGAKKVLFCTQGYDPAVHHPYHDFSE